MKVLSLFDGISCCRVALERAGVKIESYHASEIDKYAIKIAKKNYPDTVHIGDVCYVHVTKRGIEVNGEVVGPVPDGLFGGSPCTGFSRAGKGRNFEDPQSILFFEYVRILNEAKAVNPKLVFMLENVDMKREWRSIITKHLGVQPIFLDSQALCAQQRQRWYWSNFIPKDNYYEVCHPKDRGQIIADILQPESEVDEKYYLSAAALKRIKLYSQDERGVRPFKNDGHGSGMSEFGRITYPSGKTDAVTSSHAPKIFAERTVGVINLLEYKANKANKANCIDANYFKGRDNHGSRSVIQVGAKTGLIAVHSGFGRTGSKNNNGGAGPLSRDDGKAYTQNVGNSANRLEFENARIRRLTPIEVERLFSLRDNFTEGVSDSQRYKMLGNSWETSTVTHIFSFAAFDAMNETTSVTTTAKEI